MKGIQTEVDALKGLVHPHIMRLLDYNFEAVKVNSKGIQKRVGYIATELISSGELFDFVAL